MTMIKHSKISCQIIQRDYSLIFLSKYNAEAFKSHFMKHNSDCRSKTNSSNRQVICENMTKSVPICFFGNGLVMAREWSKILYN